SRAWAGEASGVGGVGVRVVWGGAWLACSGVQTTSCSSRCSRVLSAGFLASFCPPPLPAACASLSSFQSEERKGRRVLCGYGYGNKYLRDKMDQLPLLAGWPATGILHHALLAVTVICFGVWMSTHHDDCRKSLTLPVLGLGALIFIVSLIGFIGAMKDVTILLWIYLGMLCIILLAIMVFTVLAFIITNGGTGHAAAGLRYKEYHLEDYSSWFLKQLNNTKNWRHLKSCLVKSDDCNNLPKKYKTLKEYKMAELTPIEAGCCRPPSEAGVAQYMKTEWRVVAIFNVALFIVLSMIYFVGCCARRNAARRQSSKT
ncbi:hypothetical protein Taro_038020, partial [Colocasia esculenta]|nr:hypothetical protein [Colocasia esculenta]